MSTFVLVHGGWSGGWTWEKVVPLLEKAGHKVEAPDLPGHGDDHTPIPEVSLQSYADRISEVLDAQPEILPNLMMSEDGSSATIREDVIREGLLHDCSDEDVKRAKSRFVPQALAPIATPVALTEDNFGGVPRAYIETLQDRAVSPSFQKEMYERLPCQKVLSMNTSHSPFFSAPEELADHLEVLARA